MGHRPPPPPPRPMEPVRLFDYSVSDLRRQLRGRYSFWWPPRRRRAYAACLRLIRWREADLWPEKIEKVEQKVERTNDTQIADPFLYDLTRSMMTPIYGEASVVTILGGAGCSVALGTAGGAGGAPPIPAVAVNSPA